MSTQVSEEQVVNHLLFHKAILGDDEDAGRINQYIELVKQSAQGEHVSITDPFDRAIALAFELVLEEHLDPWKLDLVQFSRMYLERVRERPDVDLITSGRLVLMAWRILKLQSDELKLRADPPPPPPEEDFDPWFGIEAEDPADPDVQYNFAIIDQGQVPIDEKIRHKGDRKVTFMELLDALEEARQEAEMRAEIVARREAEKAVRRTRRDQRMDGQVHKEDQEKEIEEVWSRILTMNGSPIPLSDLRDGGDRDEVVKTLVASLFLARSSRIKLWQEDFPYGPIFVQNPNAGAHDEEDGPTPEGAEPAPAKRAETN